MWFKINYKLIMCPRSAECVLHSILDVVILLVVPPHQLLLIIKYSLMSMAFMLFSCTLLNTRRNSNESNFAAQEEKEKSHNFKSKRYFRTSRKFGSCFCFICRCDIWCVHTTYQAPIHAKITPKRNQQRIAIYANRNRNLW